MWWRPPFRTFRRGLLLCSCSLRSTRAPEEQQTAPAPPVRTSSPLPPQAEGVPLAHVAGMQGAGAVPQAALAVAAAAAAAAAEGEEDQEEEVPAAAAALRTARAAAAARPASRRLPRALREAQALTARRSFRRPPRTHSLLPASSRRLRARELERPSRPPAVPAAPLETAAPRGLRAGPPPPPAGRPFNGQAAPRCASRHRKPGMRAWRRP
mmetsp:Transcript_18512/g.70219  ORF Transcript_18512/g.70219 Transcript_18512/m.70219 type:complete len:211 (+) Transcript_18512:838-1470(+)